ncbi:hypothetical protein FACS1894159_11750 [Bacteroidia bacterium]|nr:hypothetical protein FACS1894159_11750 [Bacteroidia bacterium]
MKKVILILAAAALTVSASAQDFSWGVKAGANLATVTNTDGAELKPSIYLGAFAEWKFTDLIGFAPELVYSRQGTSGSSSEDLGGGVTVDAKTKMRLNYLNVPLTVKFYVVDNLSIDVAPQVGFMLNAKAHVKATSAGTSATVNQDLGDQFNKIDFGVGLGATYNIEKIFVQARYNLGLANLAKDYDGDDKPKNGVIQIGVGYRF